MAVRTEMNKDIMVCHIDGDIDITSSPDIKKTFDKLIAQKTPRIIVNLARVTYVDSSGLATLVEIFKNMKTYGGKLRLAGISPKVKSLFEITKLDRLFDIMNSEEEALAKEF